MYDSITEVDKMPRAEAICQLNEVEEQIHENIDEIKLNAVEHLSNIDIIECTGMYKCLLKEIERVRERIINQYNDEQLINNKL